MNAAEKPNTLENLFDLEQNPFSQITPVSAFCTTKNSGLLLDEHKEERATLFTQALNLKRPCRFFVPIQKHTDCVYQICDANTANPPQIPVADAVICNQPNTMIAVRTADCVPILLSTKSGNWIGAVHSGWRGTKASLLKKTIEKFILNGVSCDEVIVWIGPRIAGKNYEVSTELAEDFEQTFTTFSGFRDNRMIDLGIINQQLALQAGVPANQITLSPLCTFEHREFFPSYRRDGYCKTNIYSSLIIMEN
ncbi:MAG: peptidoglycan editing factor PgeF [Sumerlaeia bacterium]